MKTEQLIESLAATITPARAGRLTWRLAAAAGCGTLAGLALATGWLGLEGLSDLAARPRFWLRLALLAGLVWSLAGLVEDLARPGALLRLERPAMIVGVAAVLALGQLALSPAAMRVQLVMGSSWAACPCRVAAIALCALPLILLAMRSGAPTRLRWSGAAAGALSGALGAMLYALVCQEPGLAFVVLWYGAGILAMTVLGAMIGPFVLRWRDVRPAGRGSGRAA
jgi:hypothetical protein